MTSFTGPSTQHGGIAWRLYIFGVNVTPDLNVANFTIGDNNRAPNTAEFVLSSFLDKYTVTPADIELLYPDINLKEVKFETAEDIYNEPHQYVSNKTDSVIDRRAKRALKHGLQQLTRIDGSPDRDKQRVLLAKVGERVANITTPKLASSLDGTHFTPSKLLAMQGEAPRYPFHAGDCIFHGGDPVRLFVRDPFTLDWYYGFTGYVSDSVDSVDKDNKRTVTIRAEDALRPFRYARVTTNPAIYDPKALRTRYDAIYRQFSTESFAGLSLTEYLYLLVFGSTAAGPKAQAIIDPSNTRLKDLQITGTVPFSNRRVSVNGATDFQISAEGIGAFNYTDSRVFLFGTPAEQEQSVDLAPPPSQVGTNKQTSGPKAPEGISNLANYQAVVDHKVLVADLDTLIIKDNAKAKTALAGYHSRVGRLTGEAQVLETIDIIGSNPHFYPVDNGRLIMLMPASLGSDISRRIIDRDLLSSVAMKSTFSNRLKLIYDLAHRIEFSFWASPKGDLLMEMPLYDFQPGDFGMKLTAVSTANQVSFHTRVRANETLGPFAPRYVFKADDCISWDRSFTDDKVRTQVRATHALVQGYKDIGFSDRIWREPGVVTLDALLPQFGPRLEDIDPYGFIASQKAAAVYAALKLNQINADARQLNLRAHFRMGLGPNRPVVFEPRVQLVTLRSVSYQIVWGKGGSVQMTLHGNYLRGWSGQLTKTKEPIYEPLGGFASRPLNYALLFSRAAGGNKPADKPGDRTNAPNAQPPASTKARNAPFRSIRTASKGLTAEQKARQERILEFLAFEIGPTLQNAGIDSNTVTSTVRTLAHDKELVPNADNLHRPHVFDFAFDMVPGDGSPDTALRAWNALKDAGLLGPGSIAEGPDYQQAIYPNGTPRGVPTDTPNHLHIQLPESWKTGLGKPNNDGGP